MESTIINAAIAAAGAILGGVIAAVASLLNTRHKLREMEVAASQRLRENYLQNAREYTKAIYVPLTLAVSRLYDAYASFKADTLQPDARAKFEEALQLFLAEIARLRESGAEAFLTNELEDRLRQFCEFLDASLHSTEIVRKAMIGFRVGFGGLSYADSTEVTLTGKIPAWWRSPKMSVGFLGIGMTYEAQVLVSAPLDSTEFNTRLVADSSEIRFLVKEVTLGGKPKESAAK